MNPYLEKIAGHQEQIKSILNDHNERYYEIEDDFNNSNSDVDDILDMYLTDVDHDPHKRALVEKIRDVNRERMREAWDIQGKHDDNDLHAAKRLMSLKDLTHLVTPDNAHAIVRGLEKAVNSHSSNPSNIWKGLGTMASIAGGAVAGGAAGHRFGGLGTIGGAIAGAASFGYLGNKALGNALDDRIQARNEINYENRDHAVENAYQRLRNRYTPVK